MHWIVCAQLIAAFIGMGLCWHAFKRPINKPDVEMDVGEGAVEADALSEATLGVIDALE